MSKQQQDGDACERTSARVTTMTAATEEEEEVGLAPPPFSLLMEAALGHPYVVESICRYLSFFDVHECVAGSCRTALALVRSRREWGAERTNEAYCRAIALADYPLVVRRAWALVRSLLVRPNNVVASAGTSSIRSLLQQGPLDWEWRTDSGYESLALSALWDADRKDVANWNWPDHPDLAWLHTQAHRLLASPGLAWLHTHAHPVLASDVLEEPAEVALFPIDERVMDALALARRATTRTKLLAWFGSYRPWQVLTIRNRAMCLLWCERQMLGAPPQGVLLPALPGVFEAGLQQDTVVHVEIPKCGHLNLFLTRRDYHFANGTLVPAVLIERVARRTSPRLVGFVLGDGRLVPVGDGAYTDARLRQGLVLVESGLAAVACTK
ncbi:Hypothetical protein UVM_LOCUS118 [uncultured virus]|nr:Hypothetical protein UVM_LOCUS118 [uncultured virus]